MNHSLHYVYLHSLQVCSIIYTRLSLIDYFISFFLVFASPTVEVQTAKDFKIATYSLSGVSVLLVVIVLALCLVVYRKRPKDY